MKAPVFYQAAGVSFFIAVAGCAPLQQAPLVYSSKVTVGMDVSATATEQPGVSVNFGYKQVDAAYVPVAVAKPCDEGASTKQNCTHSSYALKKIEGTNNVGDSSVPKSALQAAEDKINQFKRTSLERDKAENEYDKAVAKARELQKALNNYVDSNQSALSVAGGKAEASRSPDEKVLLGERETLANRFNAARSEVGLAIAKKEKADEAFDAANVAGLAEAFSLVGGENKKTDAYSVFGSFDANTKARAEAGTTVAPKVETALTIGKVFSTGVASQNLTEGMRTYYAGAGVAQVERAKAECLASGSDIFSEYQKTLDPGAAADKKKMEDMLGKIAEMCGKFPSDLLLKEAKK
ncbi:hypothetical protein [Variovorax atrisoli]|uniref:hypothetical protein n=1 Tax=Variovorax atrisoli TaxID=3394203 RepID=UPI0012FE4ABC|nr:hypothetical protein [Variovorax paradoxus]